MDHEHRKQWADVSQLVVVSTDTYLLLQGYFEDSEEYFFERVPRFV